MMIIIFVKSSEFRKSELKMQNLSFFIFSQCFINLYGLCYSPISHIIRISLLTMTSLTQEPLLLAGYWVYQWWGDSNKRLLFWDFLKFPYERSALKQINISPNLKERLHRPLWVFSEHQNFKISKWGWAMHPLGRGSRVCKIIVNQKRDS